MSRIFVTGDTHGDIDIRKLNKRNFPVQSELAKEDYVIIAGDFGNVWYGMRNVAVTNPDYEIPPQHRSEVGKDDYHLKWFESRNYTTLFVDGNHENHALLASYPVEQWNGGKIHCIMPTVLHLMRGQVFEIAGKTFFTMGGASSNDKAYRRENVTWWPQELPDETEYEEALANLARYDFRVDYVITHCIGNRMMREIGEEGKAHDRLTAFLDELEERLKYKQWFFGHFHQDRIVDERHRLLYQEVVELKS
ncbi:MAG: metallophosphoesterase [Lachnospiraceae bacterium]|nr:metallophosphoesterase [Lachnospiraceae bacterium]